MKHLEAYALKSLKCCIYVIRHECYEIVYLNYPAIYLT